MNKQEQSELKKRIAIYEKAVKQLEKVLTHMEQARDILLTNPDPNDDDDDYLLWSENLLGQELDTAMDTAEANLSSKKRILGGWKKELTS